MFVHRCTSLQQHGASACSISQWADLTSWILQFIGGSSVFIASSDEGTWQIHIYIYIAGGDIAGFQLHKKTCYFRVTSHLIKLYLFMNFQWIGRRWKKHPCSMVMCVGRPKPKPTKTPVDHLCIAFYLHLLMIRALFSPDASHTYNWWKKS